MRLGIAANLPHQDPEQWACAHAQLGCSAVSFPLDYTAKTDKIDAYVHAARAQDLMIAEVGAWGNPFSPDAREAEKSAYRCMEQLRLAEYIGARCCVNISGACGSVWDGGYRENYSKRTWVRIVEFVHNLVDTVRPVRTRYTLEPMPWMVPDSPEQYRKLIGDVGREGFAAHLDVVNMINCPARYFENAAFVDECFRLLGSHVRCCHLKDTRLDTRLTVCLEEAPCGEGGMDLAHYMLRAHQADADMPMLIEHMPDKAAYLRALAYLQNICRESGIPYGGV